MSIYGFLNQFNNLIINPIIILLFALSFVYVLYGIVKFLSSDVSDAATRKSAKDAVLWGLVGMLIMFSVYGLIKVVMATFGISPNEVRYINGKIN